MAKHPNVEVSVFLPQCSEEDKKDADSYNVKLIEAVKLSGFEPVLWLASVPDGHAIDCILGHGVALGRLIPLIKKNPNYNHCKWIQVVHTAPEEIGMYKSISEGQQMQKTEIELCEMADQVVTIGPKLTDAYKHQLGQQDVFNLTPSIFPEFSDVQQASDERRTFCVLVIESGNSEDFDVKGYDIVAKAIANLKDKSYQLKFASKQRGKEDELAEKLLQCGIDRNQLIICSFDENRKTLANLFSAVDIAILPSKTEGFGLSALEAISAGLPVLVSGNSGIAEALREVPNGSQCIVDSEDPVDWARAIKAVCDKKRNVRLAEAEILRENYMQQFSWEKPCDFLVKKMYNLAFGGEMNIKVDVDDLKPEEQNMQTGMLATESVRQQEVQQPGASATSAASGSVSYPQTEDLQALKEELFISIVRNYLQTTPPRSSEEHNRFKEYVKEMRLIITGVAVGSLVITVKCESLIILEELWTDYSSGHLGEVVQNCFVTEKILKELNVAELRLKTTMDIEEYNACKMFFVKDALRDALSSDFHSTSSTSESPQKNEQWEKSERKKKIMETAKLEGTSPLTVIPTTGHGKELEELWGRKGGFPVIQFSTFDIEKKLTELSMELQRLRMEGTLPPPEIFSTDLEDELEQLQQFIWILTLRKSMKGSSHSLVPTIRTVFRLRQELKKVKMEALENTMYPTIRSGLAKFDVSLPEELQDYVSYLLDESAKLHLRKQVLQPPRALEELRVAMDKDELKTFLTIHIREGAWQVVLLFTDELSIHEPPWGSHHEIYNKDEDEEVFIEVIYCSTSGIMKAWPTEFDPGLVALCKAITNRDWKVTRLILAYSRISDEGLKNLSTALTQGELYSLTLYDIGLQSQGLEHLCTALTSVNCRLTNLDVSYNDLGDVGIMQLCNTLASVNCRLTSLNVSCNKWGDNGGMHSCNALTSVNCRLTSLNVNENQLGDNGLKHLCDALTSSNCALTKLKVGFNRLGDGGIKELSEVLTNGFCTLTSLDIGGNEFGDEGIKHLCKALTDTKCKLRNLNLQGNRYVTDDGKKYLSQMLTGTDWEDKGALRLFRSTKK